MLDPVDPSARRFAVRALMLLVPVVVLAAATPWLIRQLRPGGPRPAATSPDRPPTDEEIRASRRADDRLAAAEKTWERSTAIPASDAVVDRSGERVRWFQGFGLSVESTPPGATVLVNGKERGETPLTTSVECKPGEPVRVEVRKPGVRPERRTTRCREDQLVELSLELR